LLSAGVRRQFIAAAALFVGDLLAGVVALSAASLAATLLALQGWAELAAWLRSQLPLLLVLLIGVGAAFGLYRPGLRNLMERFRVRAVVTLLFMFMAILLILPKASAAVAVIVPLAGILSFVLAVWIEHILAAVLMSRGLWGVSVAILGSGEASRAAACDLRAHPEWGLVPAGFIDVPPDPGVQSGSADAEGFPLPGPVDLRRRGAIDTLVIADSRDLPHAQEAMSRSGARRVLLLNRTDGLATFGLQLRHFDGCVGLEFGTQARRSNAWLKRLIDLAVGLPLFALTAPLVFSLALAIKLVDPGPAFYSQKRVGYRGRTVNVLKLRTMYRDAEARLERVLASDPTLEAHWKRYFKMPKDPRVLPKLGSFLRRTSLDELPQLWNVVRGDMSLVGPRPFPRYHLDAFDSEFTALRTTVPPGLTGLWQVSARSDGDLQVQRAQDSFYIRNRSLWLDVYVLLATVPAVIKGQGAK
jgi:Undecaprenyl-phosphate galactose phosphotransferase WbaP